MKKGFTLIELVVVMTIIGILFGAGSYVYIRLLERSRISQALTDLQNIAQAVEQYHADLGYYPPDTDPRFDPGLLSYQQIACNSPLSASGPCPFGYNSSVLESNPPSSYNGPYLDVPAWPLETPWGGVYDYDYWPDSATSWRSVVGTCAGMQGGIYISVRSRNLPWLANGVGFPTPDAEEYFRAQGQDTCTANNGVIYYLIKPLN